MLVSKFTRRCLELEIFESSINNSSSTLVGISECFLLIPFFKIESFALLVVSALFVQICSSLLRLSLSTALRLTVAPAVCGACSLSCTLRGRSAPVCSKLIESFIMGAVIITKDLDQRELQWLVSLIVSDNNLASSDWCLTHNFMVVACLCDIWDPSTKGIIDVDPGTSKSVTAAVTSVGNLDLTDFPGSFLEIGTPPVTSSSTAMSHGVLITINSVGSNKHHAYMFAAPCCGQLGICQRDGCQADRRWPNGLCLLAGVAFSVLTKRLVRSACVRYALGPFSIQVFVVWAIEDAFVD